MSHSPYHHLGGSLPPEDSTYVKRQADDDLYEALERQEFCYVLTSRQMGKSSLRVRVMQQLQAEGKSCGVVDLSAIGTDIAVTAWYKGIAYRILRNFKQSKTFPWKQWWKDHEFLSPVQQLSECIDEILLETIAGDIILFIDEVDSVLSCEFNTDDFFSWIRACYNRRVDEAKYRRLSFCLIGVASPSDLISDKQRTPFNIGRAIELNGFDFEQSREALLPGLQTTVEQPDDVLQQILDWTGGQPFLTQKVCQLVMTKTKEQTPNVKDIISTDVIQNWESQDEPEHLKTIRDRIYRTPDKTSRILGLYQQILQHGRLPLKDSSELRELQLTGLVAKKDNDWVVFNAIYQTIFNLEWVQQGLASLRPYATAFQAWIDAGETDPSALIQGEALAQAKAWATDKSLSDQDYSYLAACQEEAQRCVEENLEITAQSKELLEIANAKANRRIRGGIGVLGLAGIILAGSLLFSSQMVRVAQVNAAKAQLEATNTREQAKQDQLNADILQKEARKRVQLLETESEQIQQDLKGVRLAKRKADKDLTALQDNLKLAQTEIQSAMKRVQDTNRQAQLLEQKNQQLQTDAQKLRQEYNIALKETQQAKTETAFAIRETKRAAEAEILAFQNLQETELQAERAQYLSFTFQDEPWITAFQQNYTQAINSQSAWVSDPKAIALRLLGYPNADGCEPGKITIQNGIDKDHLSILIRSPTTPKEYCTDDSVAASEHRVDLIQENTVWNLEWVGGKFRCHAGIHGRFPKVYVPKRCN